MWLKQNVSPLENNVNSRATPVYCKFIPVQFTSVKKIPVRKIRRSGFWLKYGNYFLRCLQMTNA